MKIKMTRRSSGALVAAILTAATVLASIAAFVMIDSREEQLRRMTAQALTFGTSDETSSFELLAGTLVTARRAADGRHQAAQIHWQTRFAAFGDTAAWIIILGLPSVLTICFAGGFAVLRIWVIAPLQEENRSLAAQAAATRTMQMFAHDIRKPFSALKAVTQVLQQNKAPEEAARIARKLLPEVDSLLMHVDQMITDLLRKEPDLPEETGAAMDSILDAAVRETSRKHPAAAHPITWQLRHSQQAAVSAPALTRAVANLLCNAVEVMGPKDVIRITTDDTNDHEIALTVTNSGPVIPPEILSQLFRPFFSSGKKDGTGLGLAYVLSLAEDNGGTVSASSDELNGTSFRMILPAAQTLDKPTCSLPARINGENHDATPACQKSLAPKRVLIVEDNDCYAEALQASFSGTAAGNTWIFARARTTEEALALLLERPDILICDIDLGPASDTGISVIKAAARQSKRPLIYVHSNAVLTAGERRQVEQLADGFLAKPVSVAAVATLITGIGDDRQKEKPAIAVIDDDCFIRELWDMQDEVTTYTFDSPEKFLQAVTADPGFIRTLDAVIVDYYFENSPGYTGDMLARNIRSGIKVPVIMSSDVSGLPPETVGTFDLIVSKDCISWSAIADQIRLPA
jgi:signal transduction histidine kinase/DNA-binding response OmpR family regulator